MQIRIFIVYFFAKVLVGFDENGRSGLLGSRLIGWEVRGFWLIL